MAINVLFNGIVYSIPETGDESWGDDLTSYLSALPQGCLQKTGGNFTLSADVNFGATYGLLSRYFSSRTTGPSTSGLVRLAVSDTIGWRNNAGDGNLLLSINGSNQLVFNGTSIISNGITALTGDVTATGPGIVPATVAAIQGTTVSGTTGTGNVVFSASPVLSGKLGIGRTPSVDDPLSVLYSQNSQVNARFTNATAAGAFTLVTESNSSSGGLGAYSSTYAGNSFFQDKFVLFGNSDAANVLICASAVAGTIQFASGGSSASELRMSISAAGVVNISQLTASLPIQTDASKNLVSAAIDLSGTQATGTLAAARMPALTGEATTSAGAVAVTLTNSAVIGKVLTGYVSGAGTLSATDSILQAIQKLNGNDQTNANLTGPITSVGNATAIASQTGTGTTFVVQDTPTLTTPVLGVATATSINKVAITAPATAATLTIANNKVLTVSNTITFTASDGSTLAIGGGGTLGSNAYTSTAYAPLASPTFTGTVTVPTPFTIGAVSMTATGTQLNYLASATGTTGTTSTNLVFSASPTFTGTVTIPTPFTIGAVSMTATGTQLNYLNAATGTTGTTSTNVVFSASPTLTGTLTAATVNISGVTTMASAVVESGATVSTATSGTITMGANAPGLIINSAGGTTLTIKLPSSPVTGQSFWVASVGAFTTVTWQDSGGLSGNVIGGQAAIGGSNRGQSFIFHSSSGAWISIA